MLTVLNCLVVEHDYRFVGAALLICSIGSMVSMRLFSRARNVSRAKHAAFVFMAGVAGGMTIWTTHFLAMLGFIPNVEHGFEPNFTVLSLALAIVTSLAGFMIAASGERGPSIELGGGVIGMGIALMHFTGMRGFVVAGTVSYDPGLVTFSIVAGALLGMVATNRVARGETRRSQIAGIAALILGIGMMHFSAMGAVQITPDPRVAVPGQLMSDSVLALLVVAVTILVVVLGAVTHLAEEQSEQDAVAHYRHLAMHDPLTGLPNRAAVRDELPLRLKKAAGTSLAIIAVDLNRFKEINDVYGHAAGDAVLTQTTARMRAALVAGEFFARIGGDEFIAVKSFSRDNEVEEFAARIADAFSRPNELGKASFSTSASIGIAVHPKDGDSIDELTMRADLAMYRSKKLQDGSWCWYDADADEDGRRRGQIAIGLRSAITEGALRLVFQPQISMKQRRLLGFEALLRWTSPQLGEVSPADFIPVAEQTGIIVDIGDWVLRQACREATQWPAPTGVAVNVSPVQLMRPNFAERLTEILAETGLEASRLEIEITETILIENPGQALLVLRKIKALGVRVAMDDFGTGYSSLSTLFSFPFDKIKVDRTFLNALGRQAQATSVIETVIELGHKLSIPVLAEGVETDFQAAFLKDRRCDEAQGFLYGRPVDSSTAHALALSGTWQEDDAEALAKLTA
ncbi:putative bifunctional diguanylate cyclase/phosphodiesterase [Aminobacter aganoensis]|uniref:Diguanylate cyclase (GGDEF)-like protein n=1 Tax=Aminobacter aganoensis TaxID=83264 RepID=A0A7X0FBC4_9HYPH|nr:EAL domain-containing protein [Aminobacter aganoensis]MBB6356393.1 diguanylate cyclase (GGDEF)-like protein [Aminobacter aganoensis]